MSPIEKPQTPPRRRPLRTRRKMPLSTEQLTEERRETRQTSRSFRIDEAALARQGFFAPVEKPQRLHLELRAIKRRLIRKLGFRKSAGRHSDQGAERNRNVVLVTSTRPEEGKTFTAINLALSFAIEDRFNVLLIDADVPRPKVCHHLGIDSGPGLTDLLLDPDLEPADVMQRAEEYPLTVMGEGSDFDAPAELFGSDQMAAFIEELSTRYSDRLIIIDAPPVLATADAVTISQFVDEVIFVIESNGTPERAVGVALEELTETTKNISAVLNRSLVSDRAAQYGSYEEYYYKRDRSGRK